MDRHEARIQIIVLRDKQEALERRAVLMHEASCDHFVVAGAAQEQGLWRIAEREGRAGHRRWEQSQAMHERARRLGARIARAEARAEKGR